MRRHFSAFFAVVTGCAAISGTSNAAGSTVLYGVSYAPAKLYEINTGTGSAAELSPLGHDFLNSLTADDHGRLYTAQGGTGQLLRIDPSGSSTTVLGRNNDLADVRAIAMSPGGELYALTSPTGSLNPQYLLHLDSLTGATLTTVALGTRQYQGMDFSPEGDLYAWDFEEGLAQIEVESGAFTDVNAGVVGPLMQSISFRADGTMYGATQTGLYRIFPAFGTSTLIGSFPIGTSMRGIEFVPEPGTLVLLGGMMALICRRRCGNADGW